MYICIYLHIRIPPNLTLENVWGRRKGQRSSAFKEGSFIVNLILVVISRHPSHFHEDIFDTVKNVCERGHHITTEGWQQDMKCYFTFYHTHFCFFFSLVRSNQLTQTLYNGWLSVLRRMNIVLQNVPQVLHNSVSVVLPIMICL